MAITFFGVVTSPADNGTSTSTQITITPPGSMQTGDLVYVRCTQRGTATFSIGVDGGQSWNTLTRKTGTNLVQQSFWCRYDGTWDANPRFNFSAGTNTNVQMLVYRPSDTGKLWNVDTAESTNTLASSNTHTITGRTPANNSNVSIATWGTPDDNTWGTLTGANWSKASLGAQYRNTSGNDVSTSYAYQIQTSAAATNNVSQTLLTLGPDTGIYSIITFYEQDPPSPSVTPTVTPTISDSPTIVE